MPVIFSVIICTYNRAALLSQCLESLTNQTLDKDLFEVIVIYTKSTDNTQEIAESFSKKQPNFRVVLETKKGLSHARNRGAFEAKGDYLAYSDDDCKLPKEWLAIAKSIIDDKEPKFFGGPYYAFYNSSKPEWFKDEYGSHILGSVQKILSSGEYLYGANFFIHRKLLDKLGGFNTLLGMKGNKLGYGEETELQLRIREQYPKIELKYYPQLFVYHVVRDEKMSLKFLIYEMFQNGRDSPHIFKERVSSENRKLRYILGNIILLLTLLITFPISHLCRDTNRYPFIQNYFYEKGSRVFFITGVLYEMVVVSPMKSFRKKNIP